MAVRRFDLTLTCIVMTLTSLMVTVWAGKTLRIAVLVPLSGDRNMGQEVAAAAHLAVKAMNEDSSLESVLANDYQFTVSLSDSGCDTGQVLEKVVELVTDLATAGHKVDAFVGPACDQACETAGLLAGRWSVPMISYGCDKSKVSDRDLYPTFFRTSGHFSAMAGFLGDIMTYFQWDRVTLATTDDRIWIEAKDLLLRTLPASLTTLSWYILPPDWPNIQTLLLQKSKQSHVFLLLMFGTDVLRFLDAARILGLLEGEHVFITIDFANVGKMTSHPLDGLHLTGVLDITVDVTPESQVFTDFLTQIRPNFTVESLDDGCRHYEFGIHAGLMYDSLILYSKAVEANLEEGKNPTESDELGENLYDIVIEGMTGDVHIQTDGSRESQFMLHNIQGGCYVPVARSALSCETSSDPYSSWVVTEDCIVTAEPQENTRGRAFHTLNSTIVWPGGDTVTPLGRPACGWTGELCKGPSFTIIGSVLSVAFVLVVSVGGYLAYRRLSLARQESSRAWIIHIDDLKLKGKSRSHLSASPVNSRSFRNSRGSFSTESSLAQVFTEQYIYKGEDVAGKTIVVPMARYQQTGGANAKRTVPAKGAKQGGSGDLKQMGVTATAGTGASYGRPGLLITVTLTKEVNHIMALSHPNLCKFYGVCVDTGTEMTVWEYCRKGSLQDVIHNDRKYLADMPFKISFINDITNGLRQLHHSLAGVHGRLKSSNVLVDNRWTCKLAHMTIPTLATPDYPDEQDDTINLSTFLFSPPEVLRDPTLAIPGTKAADMFGYAIILLEILTASEVQGLYTSAHHLEQAVIRHRQQHKRRVQQHHNVYQQLVSNITMGTNHHHHHHSNNNSGWGGNHLHPHHHHHHGHSPHHHHHHSNHHHHHHHSPGSHHSHHGHHSSNHNHHHHHHHHHHSSHSHHGNHHTDLYDDLEEEEQIEVKEILRRLKEGGSFPFRPHIPDFLDSKARDIITECWREVPEERPTIDHVASLIKHVGGQYGGNKKSLMEQMLDKVTREADLQAQDLEEEKNKSDQLLFQMLPPSVADCLKRQIEVKPETFQSATVYFSDIQGFTDLCSVSEPLEIVNFLNEVYYRFDSVLERYKVYKVETIGDAYVVCSGVPVPMENHATEMAMCALHLVNISANLKVAHKPQHHFLMRIGLHCGPVAAGVVGRTMPRYCLFGDTVNTASRMESTGLAGHIQISEQCKFELEKDSDYILEAREPIFVKGKGTLQTYFLKGKTGFNPSDSFMSIASASVSSLKDQVKASQPMNGEGSLKLKQQQQQQPPPPQQQQSQSPRQQQTVRPMQQQQEQDPSLQEITFKVPTCPPAPIEPELTLDASTLSKREELEIPIVSSLVPAGERGLGMGMGVMGVQEILPNVSVD